VAKKIGCVSMSLKEKKGKKIIYYFQNSKAQ
jgi:hypothetical protein